MLKVVVFDLDGTIYFGQEVANNALKTVVELQKRGIITCYCSNVTRIGSDLVGDKLRSMGFIVDDNQVYASSNATARYAEKNGSQCVYTVGAEGFKKVVTDYGLHITDDWRVADTALIAMPPQFSWQTVEELMNIAAEGKKLYACNKDPVYPVEGGSLKPGLGSFVAAVETACQREVDMILGKPSSYMLQCIAEDFSVKPDEMLMVGDLLISDVAAAKNFGCRSAWISNGYSEEPDYIISNLYEILEVKW